MKKKRSIVILIAAVCAICALGFLASTFFDWPVDTSGTRGDIAKSNRFSRKSVNGGMSNMQELLANDEEFKNNMVVAYTIMSSRASQFDALVNMSVDAAGDIKDFDKILDDMKTIKPMLKNVCSSMESAGKDLDAALSGENRADLNQNTNNAALAYTALQKQNELADRFINAVDQYVQGNSADDRLKLVRDEWIEYQIMTAALNNDPKSSDKLKEQGYLLTSDKAVTALNSFDPSSQAAIVSSYYLDNYLGFNPNGLLSEVNMPGLLNEINQNGLLNETNRNGLLNETNQNGLLNEINQNGLLNEINQNGLLNETNQNGLLNETNQNGLLNEINQNGLLNETNQNGLLNEINQNGLLNETNQNGLLNEINQNGLLNEINQNGLLNEINQNGLLNEINQNGLLNEINQNGLLNFDAPTLMNSFHDAVITINHSGGPGRVINQNVDGYLSNTISATIASLTADGQSAVVNHVPFRE